MEKGGRARPRPSIGMEVTVSDRDDPNYDHEGVVVKIVGRLYTVQFGGEATNMDYAPEQLIW